MMYFPMNRIVRLCVLPVALLAISGVASAETVDFEDLPLAADTLWTGAERFDATGEEDGQFSSGSVSFDNHFDRAWGADYWHGFAYSNEVDTETPGFENAGSAFVTTPGGNYGVGYWSFFSSGIPTISIPANRRIESIDVANTTYVARTIIDGNDFSKPFGGPEGTDADWFQLTITGKDAAGTEIGTLPVYLADFRPDGTEDDYVVEDWLSVDVSALGDAATLEFTMASSDNDPVWGMNTPAYFAIDNIVLSEVPEPATLCLFAVGAVLLLGRRCLKDRRR